MVRGALWQTRLLRRRRAKYSAPQAALSSSGPLDAMIRHDGALKTTDGSLVYAQKQNKDIRMKYDDGYEGDECLPGKHVKKELTSSSVKVRSEMMVVVFGTFGVYRLPPVHQGVAFTLQNRCNGASQLTG